MKPTVVIGQHLAADHPSLIETMNNVFDVKIFSYLKLGDAIEALAGVDVTAIIARIEYLDFFSFLAALLFATGSSIGHCFAWNDGPSPLVSADLKRMGLCGLLETTRRPEDLVAQISATRTSCANHPSNLYVEHSVFGHSNGRPRDTMQASNDEVIADLVAHGFSNRQVAEMLHFSEQTIRNRVSSLLREHGFENRTQLAGARHRNSLMRFL